jgi:anthranilate phosphoribosyltransferase
MMRLYNYIYQNLGVQYSVVHSLDGYDEISLTDTFKVQNNMGEFIYTPEKVGFKRLAQEELWGGESVEDAAKIFMNVLDNKATDAQRNAVIINSAFAIQTRTSMKPLEQCIAEATHSLESGHAREAFVKFLEVNKAP